MRGSFNMNADDVTNGDDACASVEHVHRRPFGGGGSCACLEAHTRLLHAMPGRSQSIAMEVSADSAGLGR